MTIDQISRLIRTVSDFPRLGISFKDITPILENGEAFCTLAKHLAKIVHPQTDKIIAVESRGFILGAAVAQHLSCGLVIVRKPGKLPRETVRVDFDLEYGSDSLEIHKDALKPGDRVTIMDDVLATGGTASAAEKLCEKTGAQVLGSIFLMSIGPLNGKSRLKYPSQSLL
jgi:adenine phosphoribosyltransferase